MEQKEAVKGTGKGEGGVGGCGDGSLGVSHRRASGRREQATAALWARAGQTNTRGRSGKKTFLWLLTWTGRQNSLRVDRVCFSSRSVWSQ